MKIALAALLGFAAIAGTAIADPQSDEVRALIAAGKSPAVPTGYTVSGQTNYIQRPGDPKVIEVSCETARSWTDKAIAATCRSGGADRPGTETPTRD